MKERIAKAAGICLLVIVMLILLGSAIKEPERVQRTYTVRPGDKLYSIAAELGVQNWQKWCYEVCELNGIEQGGMIYPGEELIIFTEVE